MVGIRIGEAPDWRPAALHGTALSCYRPPMRPILQSYTAILLLVLALPVLAVVPLSFSSGSLLAVPVPGWSWRWYEDFFRSGRWVLATRNSVEVAAATALLATVLGTMAALGLALGRFRGKAFVLALLAAPVVVPTIITALALYFAFARVGLNSTLAGLVLAHTVLALPYVVLVVLAALRDFDPALLRAAATLGAPPATAFRRVVLPLIAPAVATGALFAFATSFDELVVALFVAGPGQFTLPRQMLAGVHEQLSPTICAAAVLLTLVSLLLFGAAEAVRRTRA